MHKKTQFLILLTILTYCVQAQQKQSLKRDDNLSIGLFNEKYLKSHLRKESPKLFLTPAIEKSLTSKIKTDPIVKNYYAAIKINAVSIQQQPLLTREVVGRRLLATSREFLYRMGVLGMVYRVEKDKTVLKRIDEELNAVCSFTDWNPSHYLDVAEMAMGVSIAVDWAGKDLPAQTVALAKTSLIEKAIKPSYNPDGNTGWVNNNNNWNQVCNGGMIAASLIITDVDSKLAVQTIKRSLEGIPNALKVYQPDGVYPEGATYWKYGTGFTVLTIAMLESALGTDFGLASYPAFLESAEFRVRAEAPSHWYYNYADCGDKADDDGDVVLAWFATKTGNPIYLERDKFLRNPEEMGDLSRLSGPALVWLSQYQQKTTRELALNWKGDGDNPIFIFRGVENDPHQFYLAGKGGRGSVNHGNMDAGSFIFELNGIRWVIDPGNQNYNTLEQAGFNLWGRCQTCERWDLLTKNNFGHSTLSINDSLHRVDEYATITEFKDGEKPSATIDLTPVFGDMIEKATRTFTKESSSGILIEDNITTNDKSKIITWQLITRAEVIPTVNGALLRQDGKELALKILSPANVSVSVISLDPPPQALDKTIDQLKRIEIKIPAYLWKDGKGQIRVELNGQ